MKVLLLIESAGAGVGRHVVDLAESLNDAGDVVHLVYNSRRTDSMFRRRLASARSALLSVAGFPMHHSPHPHDALLIGRLRAYVRRHGPFDIVHCHSTKAGFVGRLGLQGLGAVIVYTPHAPLTMIPTLARWAQTAIRGLEVGLSRCTDAIIAVSEYEANHLEGLGIRRDKIFVVPNGVSAMVRTEDLRVSARAGLGIGNSRILVGTVGRLERQKRVDLLLLAVSHLSIDARTTLQVAIVGGGSLERDLKALASELGISDLITWVGEVEDTSALMAAFDVFVLASDYEAMPYAVLEAMAAGLPVVATRVGGVETAITDGRSGFLVKRGDVEAISRCLGLLSGQGESRSRMSREALVASRHFSLERMAAQTLAVYSRVLSQMKSSQPALLVN